MVRKIVLTVVIRGLRASQLKQRFLTGGLRTAASPLISPRTLTETKQLNSVVRAQVNCRNQAIALRIPRLRSVSVMGIYRQLPEP